MPTKAKTTKGRTTRAAKPRVRVRDMKPRKDAKGGDYYTKKHIGGVKY